MAGNVQAFAFVFFANAQTNHQIHQRQFPQWAMGYIGENLFSQEILLRYSNSSEFKPYELSGQSAAGLLVELASHVPTLSSVPHLKTVSN